jgi:hypothetical protein
MPYKLELEVKNSPNFRFLLVFEKDKNNSREFPILPKRRKIIANPGENQRRVFVHPRELSKPHTKLDSYGLCTGAAKHILWTISNLRFTRYNSHFGLDRFHFINNSSLSAVSKRLPSRQIWKKMATINYDSRRRHSLHILCNCANVALDPSRSHNRKLLPV